MKILTTRRFNALMERIKKLEKEAQIHTKQQSSSVWCWGVELKQYKKISLKDAVLALADHCGVEFIETDATPSVVQAKTTAARQRK